MSQLRALIWLKWRLFRNSMGSRKARLSRAAGLVVTVAALAVSLLCALGLGVMSWAATSPHATAWMNAGDLGAEGELILFAVYAAIFVAWATVSLTTGGGSRFDAGRLLLYPVSWRKLFAIDLLSELTSLTSIFAVPAMFSMAIGAGLGSGNFLMALPIAFVTTAFGIALAKWLAVSIGAMMRRRRSRGESVLALVGAVFGLGSVTVGQLLPYWTRDTRHLTAFRGLRWTPPGAAVVALLDGLREGGTRDYMLAVLVLAAYISLFVAIACWIARRAALGAGGAKRASSRALTTGDDRLYAGWQLPLVSPALAAVIEKEWRYAMRNPQLRTLALMPLILIVMKVAQTSGLHPGNVSTGVNPYAGNSALYREGLLAACGVLYVFMVLSSLVSNLFAYEGGGMRVLILSPVERRTILMGKNITLTFVALLLSTALIIVNQLIFRDLTTGAISFAALSFVMFAALFMTLGNWLSVRFPKRLRFGKRMNAAGVSGLLLIPVFGVMAALPLLASVAGYLAQSLFVKYATLLMFAGAALALYGLLITRQGRDLARRELEILEVISRDEG